jgi:hypothetical protein
MEMAIRESRTSARKGFNGFPRGGCRNSRYRNRSTGLAVEVRYGDDAFLDADVASRRGPAKHESNRVTGYAGGRFECDSIFIPDPIGSSERP